MAVPRSVARALAVAGWLVVGALAAVGGVAVGAPGVVAVGVAGLLVGMTVAAIARDAPGHTLRSMLEAAFAVAGTLGGLLAVAGLATLLGGSVTVVVLVVLGAVVAGWFLRGRRRSGPAATGPARMTASPLVSLTALVEHADAGPVTGLSTAALGQEWVRTGAALAGRLDAQVRRLIVARREATLDELERRDPDGFARWMAGGPTPGSDPAAYVRGGPVAGTEAA